MHADGFFERAEHVVYEDGHARDVIHVRMRDDDVADCIALPVSQGERDASGVNGDSVIYQKTGQALLGCGPACAVKRAR
jgi:hypothetical protein